MGHTSQCNKVLHVSKWHIVQPKSEMIKRTFKRNFNYIFPMQVLIYKYSLRVFLCCYTNKNVSSVSVYGRVRWQLCTTRKAMCPKTFPGLVFCISVWKPHAILGMMSTVTKIPEWLQMVRILQGPSTLKSLVLTRRTTLISPNSIVFSLIKHECMNHLSFICCEIFSFFCQSNKHQNLIFRSRVYILLATFSINPSLKFGPIFSLTSFTCLPNQKGSENRHVLHKVNGSAVVQVN